MRILFICKSRNNSYGISMGLFNSATFVVNTLQDLGVKAELVAVTDANDIDREVTKFDPEIVVTEALFITPTKMREIMKLRRHKKRVWVVRIHSKTPFLANEGMAMEWISGYRDMSEDFPNLIVAGNNREFAGELASALQMEVEYLPNIYNPRIKFVAPADKPLGRYLDIGCFGAIRPLKNHLQQAIAAINFADKMDTTLRFHINSGRLEQRGEEVLRNLRGLFNATHHELVEHPWMKHSEFLKVAKSMDIGMQVSFSESFNIVTADLIAKGVPMVVSKDVDWVPSLYRAHATKSKDIVRKMTDIYKNRKASVTTSQKALRAYNEEAVNVWLNFLEG